MKKTTISIGVLAILFTLTSEHALAHRFWLLPSTFTLSGEEQWITVDGAIANDLFYPNHVPLPMAGVTVTAPDGSPVSVENSSTGKFRSVFDVLLTQQGTYRIAEEGRTYFATWREDGEERRMRGSLDEIIASPAGNSENSRLAVSHRTVVTYVTLGAPTRGVFEARNSGIEFDPDTHPNDLFAGETGNFRFLIDGEPAAGLEVTVIRGADRYRNAAGDSVHHTGDNGRISVSLDEPGSYWMSTSVEGATRIEGRAARRYESLIVTFEVLPE